LSSNDANGNNDIFPVLQEGGHKLIQHWLLRGYFIAARA